MKRWLLLSVLVGCGPMYPDPQPPPPPPNNLDQQGPPGDPSYAQQQPYPQQQPSPQQQPYPQQQSYPQQQPYPSQSAPTRRRLLVQAPPPTVLRRRSPPQYPAVPRTEFPAEPLDASVCDNQEEFGPVILSDENLGRRHAINTHHLTDVASSLAYPIEVCGETGARQWFLQLICSDGGTPAAVLQPQSSQGGLCHNSISRYTVTCAETTSVLYVDTNMCGERDDYP